LVSGEKGGRGVALVQEKRESEGENSFVHLETYFCNGGMMRRKKRSNLSQGGEGKKERA